MVLTDVEIPSVAWRVTAASAGYFTDTSVADPVAHRHFLPLIGHGGTGVPGSMERKQKPVIVVDESRLTWFLTGLTGC